MPRFDGNLQGLELHEEERGIGQGLMETFKGLDLHEEDDEIGSKV